MTQYSQRVAIMFTDIQGYTTMIKHGEILRAQKVAHIPGDKKNQGKSVTFEITSCDYNLRRKVYFIKFNPRTND